MPQGKQMQHVFVWLSGWHLGLSIQLALQA